MIRRYEGLVRACALGMALGASPIPAWAHTQSAETPAVAADMMDEATFVRVLVQHYEGGIDMARLEERRGASAEVKALATKMRRAQERELADLRKHASQAVAGTSGSESAKGAPLAMEAHARQMADRLEQTTTRSALDREFVEHMLMHHEMTMQLIEHTNFKDKELGAIARQIAETRKSDVAELEKQAQTAKNP